MNMNGNVCREVQREIDQSELHQTLSAESEGHVTACAACAMFRDERLRLRELVGGLHPVSAPADFEMRLRARIARERDLPKQPFIFRLVMSTPAIVVAAVLVIAVGAAVFISQRRPARNQQQVSNTPVEPANPGPAVATENPIPRPIMAPPPVNVTSDKSKPSGVIVRNTPKTSAPGSSAPQVSEFNTKGAQSFHLSDRVGEVSLTTPTRPMVVTVYDQHGATRKIELPPISFGSLRLTDKRTQVSMTNTKDW